MYNGYDSFESLQKKYRLQRLIALAGGAVLIFGIFFSLLWEPLTGVWSQERNGMANYRQATQDRQITVEEARSELEAAEAQAEAIRTMGQAARDNPEYRSQIYIQALSEALANGTLGQVIYVPEGSLPITEAGRR